VKVVVYPHDLCIGGSEINAIDLAAAISDLGHEVIVYAVPGPLEDYIVGKGLRYAPAYRAHYQVSVSHIAQLAYLVNKNKVDLVHAYEWPPCVNAFFGAGLLLSVPVVCTVLGMRLAPIVPRVVPLIKGTEKLAEAARVTHQATVSVIEPPIDTESDSPANDGTGFRAKYGVTPDELLVVTVSRLAIDLKLDALIDAIDALDRLATSWPVRLIIVGDGQAATQLRTRADAVNRRHNRDVVTLAGATLDPRSAYAAADIVVGMGSSALRALAHGKPIVVQGERGFSAPFDADHESLFFRQGFHGVGDVMPCGSRLAKHLAALLADPRQRAALGARGREVVVSRYSLRTAAARLVRIYDDAIATRPHRRVLLPDVARSAWLVAGYEASNHCASNKRAHAELVRRKLAEAAEPAAGSFLAAEVFESGENGARLQHRGTVSGELSVEKSGTLRH
jgi:L-malate glycosyltransferase